jgi:hypothetical protein
LAPKSPLYGGTAPRTKASMILVSETLRRSQVQPIHSSRGFIPKTGSARPIRPITLSPCARSTTRKRRRRPYPLDTGIDQCREHQRHSRESKLLLPETGTNIGSILATSMLSPKAILTMKSPSWRLSAAFALSRRSLTASSCSARSLALSSNTGARMWPLLKTNPCSVRCSSICWRSLSRSSLPRSGSFSSGPSGSSRDSTGTTEAFITIQNMGLLAASQRLSGHYGMVRDLYGRC